MAARRLGTMLTVLWVAAAPILAAPMAAAQPTGAATPDEVPPPLPPPRPERPSKEGPVPQPEAAAPRPAANAPKPTAQAPKSAAGAATCEGRLAQLGVKFEARPTLKDGRCHAPAPLLVSELPDGIIVTPPATTACPVAEALARWAVEVLKPEGEKHFKRAPKSVSIGTSYECRNQRSGGKLSEHAFANGVDVMGFAFEGRPSITVGPHPAGSPEAAFQAAARAGACVHFTTVLGPGSDAAHADHLHLDMRDRKAGYRICQ